MDEPVLVRPLSATFSPGIIVVEAVGLFYESEVDENVDVADDGSARNPPGIGDGLVAGEALVGLAVAVGEDDGKRSPGRSANQGEVALGQLLKDDQRMLFLFAGCGL